MPLPFPSAMLLSTGSGVAPGALDGFSPSGAWSAGRKLLAAFAGSYTADVAGAATALYDQSGTGSGGNKDFTDNGVSTRRPALTTAGPNSKACLDFDGSTDGLMTSAVLSTFLSATTGWMVITLICDAVTLNSGVGYQNDWIFGDANVDIGFSMRNLGSGRYYANNYTGAETKLPGLNTETIADGNPHALSLRHEGGNLYFSIDNGVEYALTSGNTADLTFVLSLGARTTVGGVTQGANIKVFEALTFSTIPNATDRSTIVQTLMTWCGATVSGNSGVFDAYTAGLTAAYSAARRLVGSWKGSLYHTVSSAVDKLFDQACRGNELTDGGTSTRRPAIATVNGHDALDFDGSTDALSSFENLSEFITAAEGYVCVSIVPDTITLNNGTTYTNHGVVGDQGGYHGVYLKNAGTPKTAIAYNYDGSEDVASSATINTGTAYVIELRHQGGHIYIRVNGGTEVDGGVTGSTQSLANTVNMGRGYSSLATAFDGKIQECVYYNADPGLTVRNAIMNSMKTEIGA